MRVDLDRLREVIHLAAKFDWTGSSSDVERFCESANWTVVTSREHGSDIMTDLDIADPTGFSFVRESRMCDIVFSVSDVLNPESAENGAISLARFSDVSSLLWDELGEPDRGSRRESVYFRWNLPKIVIFAVCNSRENYVRLVDKKYQAGEDYIDEHIIARREENAVWLSDIDD